MEDLRPMIQSHVMTERGKSRNAREKGELANFSEGDYVLDAREYFYDGEKLYLR